MGWIISFSRLKTSSHKLSLDQDRLGADTGQHLIGCLMHRCVIQMAFCSLNNQGWADWTVNR